MHILFTKPSFKLNIYGVNNSGLTPSEEYLSTAEIFFLYYRLRFNVWVATFQLKWTGRLLEVFLTERIPLFNWFDGKKTRIIDQDGNPITEGFLENYPTVVQPFLLDSIVTEIIIKFRSYDQVKKMFSLKSGIWKVDLESGSVIYTDRVTQVSRILKLLNNRPQIFELFHSNQILVRPKYSQKGSFKLLKQIK